MKILFTGDVCFKYQNDLTREASAKILAPMKDIFASVDYRVMNLETPLAPEGCGEAIVKSGPNIIGRPQNLAFLTEAGCDLAVLANNHTGDYGEEPLFRTMELLDENHIARIGAGRNLTEAYKAHRIESDGKKISFLAVNENEFGIADDDKAGSAGFDLELIGDAIEREREASDYVIVIFHGGNEHNVLPSPLCRERYRTIIRLGADALIGGHTHCIQGYEYYKGKPIVYSMGNFLFRYNTERAASWYTGYVTELELGEGLTVRPIPYRMKLDPDELVPFAGAELDQMLAYIAKLSSYIPDTKELKRLYKGWCTTSGMSYIKSMNAKPEYFTEHQPTTELAKLKNLLSCEAHNELCRTTLNLAFFGELDAAREWKQELDELAKLPC